jgi:starch synthase
VIDGETGLLVDYTANDVSDFENRFAKALNQVLSNPNAKELGKAGRVRASNVFAWESIALKTIDLYKEVL